MVFRATLSPIAHSGNRPRSCNQKPSGNFLHGELTAKINEFEPPKPKQVETDRDTQIHQSAIASAILSSDSVPDDESRLSAYIRWAHRGSQSGDYPTEISLKLLDEAWKAQKRLWKLRQQNS